MYKPLVYSSSKNRGSSMNDYDLSHTSFINIIQSQSKNIQTQTNVISA